MDQAHKVIIVGGGAGGLALASKLGRSLGKAGTVSVTLIDNSPTHVWKPLLHEVAAGSFDSHVNEVSLLAQAACAHFRFRLGQLEGLDRRSRMVHVAPTHNAAGEEIIPRRSFAYDTLVIGIGSVSNDFGIPGVKEHCLFLDSTHQAERFQRQMLESYIKAHAQGKPLEPGQLDIAIVGAGATGVELAAQLYEVSHLLNTFGLDEVQPADIKLSIIEAADRVLPGVPTGLSDATLRQLEKLNVEVLTSERVTAVTETGIETQSGRTIKANLKVWAAGIKAPDVLANIDDLESNGINQLVVRPTLQTTRDDSIYALGDCAACPWPDHEQTIPPRAQAAHQQATLVYKSIRNKLAGEPLPEFRYKDYGSLVSLGKFATVGNLMGNLLGNVRIEGVIARLVYLSLYKMHQLSLFGPYRTVMLTLSNTFRRSVHPNIKLH